MLTTADVGNGTQGQGFQITKWCQSVVRSMGGGGGVGTRPWGLALLACGSAYWPLAFEPSAMTSRHPYCCGHPHCRGHPPSWGGIQNATSARGVLPRRPDQCPGCGHHKDPGAGRCSPQPAHECHTRPWVLAGGGGGGGGGNGREDVREQEEGEPCSGFGYCQWGREMGLEACPGNFPSASIPASLRLSDERPLGGLPLSKAATKTSWQDPGAERGGTPGPDTKSRGQLS